MQIKNNTTRKSLNKRSSNTRNISKSAKNISNTGRKSLSRKSNDQKQHNIILIGAIWMIRFIKNLLIGIIFVIIPALIFLISWVLIGQIEWGTKPSYLFTIMNQISSNKLNVDIGKITTHGMSYTQDRSIRIYIDKLHIKHQNLFTLDAQNIVISIIPFINSLIPFINLANGTSVVDIGKLRMSIDIGVLRSNNHGSIDISASVLAKILSILYNSSQYISSSENTQDIKVRWLWFDDLRKEMTIESFKGIKRQDKYSGLTVTGHFNDGNRMTATMTCAKRFNKLYCNGIMPSMKFSDLNPLMFNEMPYNIHLDGDIQNINVDLEIDQSQSEMKSIVYDFHIHNGSFGILHSNIEKASDIIIRGTLSNNLRYLNAAATINSEKFGVLHIKKLSCDFFNESGFKSLRTNLIFNTDHIIYHEIFGWLSSINKTGVGWLKTLIPYKINATTIKIKDSTYTYDPDYNHHNYLIDIESNDLRLSIPQMNNISLYNTALNMIIIPGSFIANIDHVTIDSTSISDLELNLKYPDQKDNGYLKIHMKPRQISLSKLPDKASQYAKDILNLLHLESPMKLTSEIKLNFLLHDNQVISLKNDLSADINVTLNDIHSSYIVGLNNPIITKCRKKMGINKLNCDADINKFLLLDTYGAPINSDFTEAKCTLQLDLHNINKGHFVIDNLSWNNQNRIFTSAGYIIVPTQKNANLQFSIQSSNRNAYDQKTTDIQLSRNADGMINVKIIGTILDISPFLLLMDHRKKNIVNQTINPNNNYAAKIKSLYNSLSLKVNIDISDLELLDKKHIHDASAQIDIKNGIIHTMNTNFSLMSGRSKIANISTNSNIDHDLVIINAKIDKIHYFSKAIGLHAMSNIFKFNNAIAIIKQAYDAKNLSFDITIQDLCYTKKSKILNIVTGSGKSSCYKSFLINGSYDPEQNMIKIDKGYAQTQIFGANFAATWNLDTDTFNITN